MKFLTALALAQFVLIALLFLRVAGLESSLEDAADAAPPTTAGTNSPRTILAPRKPAPVAAFDEERLREIIREELAALEPAANPGVAAETDPQREIDYEYRLEEVTQTLDFYSQMGQIGPAEMARLESDIARLRPDDRDRMLRRLVQELNTGAIEGRL